MCPFIAVNEDSPTENEGTENKMKQAGRHGFLNLDS